MIEWLGGNCPVQAEGSVDGYPFYFRARGDRWCVEIASTKDNPDWFDSDENLWVWSEEWGDNPFAAGWMPETTALEMIAKGILLWRNRHET
jgi:hypothetical protein